MQRENCSLHEVWWLWHTLDKCRELFNHMPKKMDTPITWFAWNIVALHCTCRSLVQTVVRLTEAMQLLKHLAEALQSLQSCCQTSLDIGCTQVWNLSQMHLSTFPKGMWALLDCSGTALRWSRWELFSSWRLMAVAYSWQMWGPLQPHAQADGHPRRWCTWNVVALDCRLTEVMQLLKHLAEALQSLQSCCQTSLDIGCTQVWNLSQMHLSTFPKGMWALLDCSGTALRWSRWELFSSWGLMAVAYSWQM